LLLQNAVSEFIINQEVRGNSENTIEYYTLDLGYFVDFMGIDKDLCKITLTDLHGYYMHIKERKITKVSIQSYIRAVRTFLNWCYSEGYISEKLTERFKLPRSDLKIFDVLDDYEIQKLLSCFDLSTVLGVRNWCICALMLDSGLRKSEVVRATFCRFRATDFLIINGKGNRQRRVPLGLLTRKYLAKYDTLINNQGRKSLFLKNDGSPLTANTIKMLFQRLKNDTGMERLHPHLLRHTFATRFIENGGDVFTLQQILGHTTLDMSKKYTHLGNKNTFDKFRAFSPLDNMKKPP